MRFLMEDLQPCSSKHGPISSEGERDVLFVFSVDYRSRLDTPLPRNYFGNCIIVKYFIMNATKFEEDNGIAMVAKRIGDFINGLQRGPSAGVWEALTPPSFSDPRTQIIGVAGSNKFGFYGSDFGWGRPWAVEITSIDRTGAFSLTEAGDDNGGVEIGLALTKHEMEAFASLFVELLSTEKSSITKLYRKTGILVFAVA